MLLGINSGQLTSYDNLVFKNALAQARNFWEEDIATGHPVRDDLTYLDSVTGQPNRIDPGRRAVTVALTNGGRYRAGVWVLRWTGVGQVQVDWANGAGTTTDTTGRTTATIDTPADGVQIRILQTDPSNPVRLRSLTHIDDEASPAGFQPWWLGAWRFAGNRIFRPMDWMNPSFNTAVTIADLRSDTWWTQSSEGLDSARVTLSGDRTGALGQRRDIYRGGSSTGGWGIIVRGTSDGWHFRVMAGGLEVGDQLRLVGAGNGPVVTSIVAADAWPVNGCSIQTIIDACSALDAVPWVTTPMAADEQCHRYIARRFRDAFPLLPVYKEHSNEVWNTNFRAYYWHAEEGLRLGVPSPNGEEWYRSAQAHAVLAERAARWWQEEFDAIGAGARLNVVFAGQNAGGEHWYQWRTIINPDADPRFPAYPRRVIPIKWWATAPYFRTWAPDGFGGRRTLTAAELDALTDTQLEDNLRNDLQYALRDQDSGSYPFRGGGMGLHVLLASERAALQGGLACQHICYEGGQEMFAPGGSSPSLLARLRAFQLGANMRRLFDEYLAGARTKGTQGMVLYNGDGSWNTVFFGLYANPFNLGEAGKYQAMRAFTSALQLIPAEPPTHHDVARVGALQVRQSSQLASVRVQHQTAHRVGGVSIGIDGPVLVSQRAQHQHGARVGLLSTVVTVDPIALVSRRDRHVHEAVKDTSLQVRGLDFMSVRDQHQHAVRVGSMTPLAVRPVQLESRPDSATIADRVSAMTVRTLQGEMRGPIRRRYRYQPGVISSFACIPDVTIWRGAAVGIAPFSGLARPFQVGDEFAGFAIETVLARSGKLVITQQLCVASLDVSGATSNAVLARFVRVLADNRFAIAPDVDDTPGDYIGRVLVHERGTTCAVYAAARSLWVRDEIVPPPGIPPVQPIL